MRNPDLPRSALAAAFEVRLSAFVNAALPRVAGEGCELAESDLQRFLGLHEKSPGATCMEDVEALVAEASVTDDPKSPPGRSWTAALTQGLGLPLLRLFDASEAAGAAAGYRFMVDKVRRLNGLDLKKLQLDVDHVDPRKFPTKLLPLRRLYSAPFGNVGRQLKRRLRPPTWRFLLSETTTLREVFLRATLNALLEKETLIAQQAVNEEIEALEEQMHELPSRADLELKRSVLEGGRQIVDMYGETYEGREELDAEFAELEARENRLFQLRNSKVDKVSDARVDELIKEAVRLRGLWEVEAQEVGSAISLCVFMLLSMELSFEGKLELTADEAINALLADSSSDRSQLESLFVSNPSLFRYSRAHCCSLFSFRLWACLKSRDAAEMLRNDVGISFALEGGTLRRWVSARLFDKDVKCANPERIATARARFLKQRRNLVLGGERYSYCGDAAAQIDGLIKKAHSALEIPLGLPEANPQGQSCQVAPTALLGAFNCRELPNLIDATSAESISKELRNERKKREALSRLTMTDDLPANKTLDSSSLYEQVRAGVWRDPKATAPFNLSAADIEEFKQAFPRRVTFDVDSLVSAELKYSWGELDIFEALRMGMEYSAICTEIKAGSYLFKRIQLKPQESAEVYGRMLLSKPEVIAQLRRGTRNFHHRALRLLKLHWIKTETQAREKGDTGLQVHVKWIRLNKLELEGLESLESVESFEDEHLAQAESVAFEQLMASGRNLRSFKKDPDLKNAKSSIFAPEIQLESSELKDCPSVRELLAEISDSNRAWVEGNDWAFRTAERMLEVLGLSFEEFAQTQNDEALIKHLKQLGVVQRSGKRVSRKQNGEMEWLITPPAFGLIKTKFFQYVDAYLKRPKLDSQEEVDVLADEFKAKRELMKVEFGADGRGKMKATEMALLSIKSTFKAQLNATGQSLILDAKALGEAAASRGACKLGLQVLALDSWAEHERRQAEIFGAGGEGPQVFEASKADVPLPIFHYSQKAVLARGWSERMIRQLVISHDYKLLLLPDEGNRRSDNVTVVIPARWVWEAEKGWAGKLLGAKKRAKRRAKRPVSKAKGKTKPVSSAGR